MRPSLALTLLFLLVSCGQSDPDRGQSPLAVVGEAVVTPEDFDRTYVARLISNGENDSHRARSLHLNNLIDAELLRQEARRLGLGQDSVGRRRMETIRKRAVGDAYFEREFLSRLEPPTDEEIRQAFARWKEKAVVRHLFYRDSTQADEAYKRLASGVSFLDEAQRCYRTAEYDSSAGYLGPVGYFEVDDAFAEAAFSLQQHEFSRPVRSRFGYHIILLEDKLRSPLLTESEFQTRREGISSQWRLRKRRLEGDRFVRSFMEGLDVGVNAEAIESLAETIQLIENRVAPDRPNVLMDESNPAPAPDISASTPLAWYTFRGEERVFTLDDYAAWFDDLPFREARYRTGASVGRALRNEALAVAGDAESLGTDPVTLHEIDFQERIYLAGRMRDLLRQQVPESVRDEQIEALIKDLKGADMSDFTAPQDSQLVAPDQRLEAAREKLGPLVAERELLERLRAEIPVRVDSALFEAMVDFGATPR